MDCCCGKYYELTEDNEKLRSGTIEYENIIFQILNGNSQKVSSINDNGKKMAFYDPDKMKNPCYRDFFNYYHMPETSGMDVRVVKIKRSKFIQDGVRHTLLYCANPFTGRVFYNIIKEENYESD